MPTKILTAAVAAAAVEQSIASGRKIVVWDKGAVSGFVLECRPSGSATYALRYTDPHGTQRQHKIGGYKDLTFDKARREAIRLRSEVVLGHDPAGNKEQRKATPLYGEVASRQIADAKLHLRSSATMVGYMNRHILPRWGKVRVCDITQQDVAAWLAEKRQAGYAPATIEKMRALLGRTFELGKRWDIPGCDRNPALGIARKPLNNARERYLNAAEAERLKRAVEGSRSPLLRYIVGLALLTGARSGELLRAEWQHVDLERKAWLIPTSKTGKKRHVPLSQAAIELIRSIPRVGNAKFLFPSPNDPTKPISTIKHSWDTARREARLPDVRIHDLRHSAASFMINAGVDLFAVGKVLGHASYQSTQRYSHLANDTLLAAVEAGAKKLQLAWASPN